MTLDIADCDFDISTPQMAQGEMYPKISIKVDKIQVALYFEYSLDEYLRFPAYKFDVLHGNFGKKGVVHKAHPSSAFTAMSQPLENGGCLFIRYGYSHKRFKAFLEFNPNHIDMFELRGHLTLLLHHGYDSLLERGIVTYCEFAADVKDAKLQDYLYLDAKLRCGSSLRRFIGSDYVGSERSNRSFLAYDKRKELLDHKKDNLTYDLLRIEARLRGAKYFPLKDISAVESPFDSFHVIDRAVFESSDLPALSALREQLPCFDGCLQLAYASLSPKLKQQARCSLKSMQPNWWKPKDIWKTLPNSKFAKEASI
ncbi:MAG: hypothetical protein ABJA62_00880 [Luteimonas sp.]